MVDKKWLKENFYPGIDKKKQYYKIIASYHIYDEYTDELYTKSDKCTYIFSMDKDGNVIPEYSDYPDGEWRTASNSIHDLGIFISDGWTEYYRYVDE